MDVAEADLAVAAMEQLNNHNNHHIIHVVHHAVHHVKWYVNQFAHVTAAVEAIKNLKSLKKNISVVICLNNNHNKTMDTDLAAEMASEAAVALADLGFGG